MCFVCPLSIQLKENTCIFLIQITSQCEQMIGKFKKEVFERKVRKNLVQFWKWFIRKPDQTDNFLLS